MIDKAFKFAMNQHLGQYRKSYNLPYFVHLTEVVKRVCMLTNDEDVWCAAVLHDYIEDCALDVTYEDKHEVLTYTFNKRIADIVLECSRLPDHESKLQKFEFLQSFADKSMESIIIKICDRRCNVSDYTLTGSRKYASKYALQAYPLYQAYLEKQHQDHGFVFYNKRVKNEIAALQKWMEGPYADISLFQKGQTDRIKHLVTA